MPAPAIGAARNRSLLDSRRRRLTRNPWTPRLRERCGWRGHPPDRPPRRARTPRTRRHGRAAPAGARRAPPRGSPSGRHRRRGGTPPVRSTGGTIFGPAPERRCGPPSPPARAGVGLAPALRWGRPRCRPCRARTPPRASRGRDDQHPAPRPPEIGWPGSGRPRRSGGSRCTRARTLRVAAHPVDGGPPGLRLDAGREGPPVHQRRARAHRDGSRGPPIERQGESSGRADGDAAAASVAPGIHEIAHRMLPDVADRVTGGAVGTAALHPADAHR